MGGIVRLNAPDPLAEYVDSADEIYGTGVDGSVHITSDTHLSSDMFYYNLTIDPATMLHTHGYRVFVKNLLTMGENSVIGLPGGWSTSGSIAAGGADTGESVTNSLGGSSSDGYSATAPTAANGGSVYYRYASQAITGYQVTASSNGPVYLRGGAGSVGGMGGGVVIVAARYISLDGPAQISATGGANAGGGVVILVSTSSVTPSGLTLNVSGQNGGGSGTAIYLEVD